MIRWRGDLLNGRWKIVQDHDDYWRVHDTTTGQHCPGLYLTSRAAREGAEAEYFLAHGITVQARPSTDTLDAFTRTARRENW